MEFKPFIHEKVFYFKQSDQIRGIEGLLVVPENEFDNQIVDKIIKQRRSGRGDAHILMREEASNGLVYDTKTRAKKAVPILNSKSQKLRENIKGISGKIVELRKKRQK